MADTSYLKYIPVVFSNPFMNAIAITFIPGVFYIGAAYGHLMLAGASLLTSILISVLFATMEYIVRVPIIKYSSEVAGMSNGVMQSVWVVITLLLGWLSDGVIPHAHDK